MLIGILAVHGSFNLHKKILDRLNICNILVKNKHQLLNSDALILPGGESTVISQYLCKQNLHDEIKRYSLNHSIYGTCAGGILMSSYIKDNIVKPLKIANIAVHRNSWGSQIDSFTEEIKLSFSKNLFKAIFIRAPRYNIKSKKIKILAEFNNEPVLIQEGRHLVSSFHPELGHDTRIHEYFLKLASNGKI